MPLARHPAQLRRPINRRARRSSHTPSASRVGCFGMHTTEGHAYAQAPVEAVWDVLYESDQYAVWGPWSASEVEREGRDETFGAGCVRCLITGNHVVREEILECEAPYRMIYRMLPVIPGYEYIGMITLYAQEPGTRITWASTFHSRDEVE